MQGFGAAAVTSVNTTLIRIIYPKAQLGRGMGINATVVAVSSVAGPTLAAGILSVAEWPWLFAVNIPIGLVALWLSRRFLPDNPVRVSARRFDWRDAVMNALTFGLLMASVEGFRTGLTRDCSPWASQRCSSSGSSSSAASCASLSDPAVRPAAHPDLFGFGRHVDLLVPRANAGHGSAAVLPATRNSATTKWRQGC